MTRLAMLWGLVSFLGAVLVLSELRWCRRANLYERLRPYAAGGMGRAPRSGAFSVDSLREVIGPLSRTLGGRIARVFGVDDDLSLRLERVHSPLDSTAFRVRQLAWSGAAFAAAGAASVAISPPPLASLPMIAGAPLLAFLIVEQRLSAASAAWQRRIFLELPVVAEQLGMLMASGFSLGASLNRIASRSRGACATDLAHARKRTRQGLSDVDALREWSALADVPALERLVGILALDREAGDLGRLIAEEARSIRREAHRELIETIERRNQSVWIPVTVAALVPGVILMAVPFVDALSTFSEI